MITNVNGAFKSFDASIDTMGNDFTTANIDLWIDPSSITTGDPKRDEHLKSADFFDVEHYKQIGFQSSTIGAADSKGHHELWGELTMKGIKKNVKLAIEFGGMLTDPWGNEKAGFTVSGKISRKEWGLVWNTTMETGGIMVGDEITISCEIELAKNTGTAVMELEGAPAAEALLPLKN